VSKSKEIDPSKAAVVENVFIRVRSIPPKRRRANREFSRTPIDIPTAELTAEEIEAIQADPMLVVEFGGDVPAIDGNDSNTPHNPASERADSSAAEQAPPTEAAKPSPQAPQGPAGKAQPKKTKAAR
jgi:hypothetical protein